MEQSVDIIRITRRSRLNDRHGNEVMMGEKQNWQVIKDYFLGFFRDFNPMRLSLLIVWLYLWVMFSFGFGPKQNWLMAMPIPFAMLSGIFHNVSLPFMMYLVPFSREQREAYIRRYLYVKVSIPMLFAGLCDIAEVFWGHMSAYGLVLQLVTVFSVTYICGILCDGVMREAAGRKVYGNLKSFVGAILAVCQICTAALFAICMNPINVVEFWVIFLIEMAVMLPILVGVGREWKTIRRNFADYEMLSSM